MRLSILTILFLIVSITANAKSYLCKPHFSLSSPNPETKQFSSSQPPNDILLSVQKGSADLKILSESTDTKKFKIFNKIDEDWFMAYNSFESLIINFDATVKMLVLTKPTSVYSFINYYKCN